MSVPLLTVALRAEHDVVVARQRARQLARLLGFDAQDQVRVATAVSELARNVVQYAGRGQIQFALEGRTSPQVLSINVSDEGPGIAELTLVLSGRYRSPTGMGVGLLGARRLMDQFQVESAPGQGTRVQLRKLLPRSAPVRDQRGIRELVEAVAREGLQNPLAEVQHQNQELVLALDELRRRQEELVRLNRELEETNRGVLALYAELDEKAEHLRRADDMKTRFLSNMSHEFRTPLSSITALSRLLQQRSDGDLSAEQEKQVGFIVKAAQDLTELVDDLLDLAKVEAGKIVVRPVEFELKRLFGALRGMLRPLLVGDSVHLVFDEPQDIPPLYGDEGKVSQILRNFLSNALKFTERGEIRVSATLEDEERVAISVADTGIGIAPEDLSFIFDEFVQVEHQAQRRVKGTGLGLALSRKLAEVLGGGITVDSAPGRGSTFTLHLPLAYASLPALLAQPPEDEPGRRPVLILEDNPAHVHVYERLLRHSEFQILSARSLREAEAWLQTGRPCAVVIDIQLLGEDAWGFLAGLKAQPETRELPAVVVTNVDDERKALALGADAYRTQPVEGEWLLATLRRLTTAPSGPMLVVDDDQAWRYLLGGMAAGLGFAVVEAADGLAGVQQAGASSPAAVLLDLVMPELEGLEVLRRLRADPATARLPVVVTTSKALDAGERGELDRLGAVLLPKSRLSAPDASELLAEALRRAGGAAEAAAAPRGGA